MRFLLDNNLSALLVPLLEAAGHDVIHVRDVGLAAAPDHDVLSLARGEQRVLISADTDFGTLLARSGASAPSVVLLRRVQGRRAGRTPRLRVARRWVDREGERVAAFSAPRAAVP